jgi:hypothetical protein
MKQKRGWRDDKRDLYGSRSALGSLYDSNPSRHIIHDSLFYFYFVLLLHILWHKSMRHSYYTRRTCQYLGMSFTMTYISWKWILEFYSSAHLCMWMDVLFGTLWQGSLCLFIRFFPVAIICLGCLSRALKVLCCVFPRCPNPVLELF